MATWTEFADAAPALADRVRGHLDAYTNKTLATLRLDGSPRISATETDWHGGDLWIGSMWRALKAQDLRRDPRFALHSGTGDPPPHGDSKLAGIAIEVRDAKVVEERHEGKAPPGPSHLFRLDLREVSSLAVDEEAQELVIDVWTPDGGLRTVRRR